MWAWDWAVCELRSKQSGLLRGARMAGGGSHGKEVSRLDGPPAELMSDPVTFFLYER